MSGTVNPGLLFSGVLGMDLFGASSGCVLDLRVDSSDQAKDSVTVMLTFDWCQCESAVIQDPQRNRSDLIWTIKPSNFM